VSNAPAQGIVAQEMTFDGDASQSTIGIAKYTWDFGDGNTAEGAVTAHAYAAPGEYTVILTVTDTTGQSGNATIQVTIN